MLNNYTYTANTTYQDYSTRETDRCYTVAEECYTAEELFWFSFCVFVTIIIALAVLIFIAWRVWKLRKESELDFSL